MRRSNAGTQPEMVQPGARVLFVNHAGVIGGAELILLDIARWYRRTSSVLLLADGPLRSRLAKAEVPVQVLEGSAALHGFRRNTILPSAGAMVNVLQISRKIARQARDYDLIYANTQKAFFIGCAASILARRPLLWHLHDILDSAHFSPTNIRLGVNLANRVAAKVVAISRATADAFVAQGGRSDKIGIVYNGIDPTPFQSLSPTKIEAARSQMGWDTAPVLGYFSRLAPWKGQHVVLEAIAMVPEIRAVFVGGPLFQEEEYAERLRESATALNIADRVQFLGARDDVPRLMQMVDLIAHTPVTAEPFGRVVVEAMLAGKPLVASRSGGIVEIVTDGEHGVLISPGDATELASALTKLLNDPEWASQLAHAGQAHARENFTLESMLQGITHQIEEVARS